MGNSSFKIVPTPAGESQPKPKADAPLVDVFKKSQADGLSLDQAAHALDPQPQPEPWGPADAGRKPFKLRGD